MKPKKQPKSIDLATSEELLDELQRRSIGLFVCIVKVDEGNVDTWDYRIKGSIPLMSAMSGALSREIEKNISERTQQDFRGF